MRVSDYTAEALQGWYRRQGLQRIKGDSLDSAVRLIKRAQKGSLSRLIFNEAQKDVHRELIQSSLLKSYKAIPMQGLEPLNQLLDLCTQGSFTDLRLLRKIFQVEEKRFPVQKQAIGRHLSLPRLSIQQSAAKQHQPTGKVLKRRLAKGNVVRGKMMSLQRQAFCDL